MCLYITKNSKYKKDLVVGADFKSLTAGQDPTLSMPRSWDSLSGTDGGPGCQLSRFQETEPNSVPEVSGMRSLANEKIEVFHGNVANSL